MIELSVTLIVGGVDRSTDMVSLKREHSLCTPGQTLTLEMRPSISGSDFYPWDTVTLLEQGVLVFTGYVSLITLSRPPQAIALECQDTYKRAVCTLTERGLMTDGETAGWWVDYLCNLAGLSYEIVADNADIPILEDIPMEIRPVSDCLFSLAACVGWIMRVEPDGSLAFMNVAQDIQDNVSTIEWSREIGDENSRNECMIWGMGINDRTVRSLPGIGAGRTMVFANPEITSHDLADYIAKFALDQFSNLDDALSIKTLGNPNIRVGNILAVNLGKGGYYCNVVTDLSSEITPYGYALSLTCGRKCLRLPALPMSGINAVYVGTTYFLARSNNFYSSGSDTVWENVNTSGSVEGLITSMSLDRFTPMQNGYVTSGSGVYISKRLYRSDPLWWNSVSPYDFQSATGVQLRSAMNVKNTPARQGTLYSQAIGEDGNIYVGWSGNYGRTWEWSDPIPGGIVGTPILGFDTGQVDRDVVFTAGSGGGLYKNTSGSLLNFSLMSVQADAYGSICNIEVPKVDDSGAQLLDQVVYIGGQGMTVSSLPTFTRTYASDSWLFYDVGEILHTSLIGPPDGVYALYRGYLMSTYIYPFFFSPIRSVAAAAVRFWAKDPTGWNLEYGKPEYVGTTGSDIHGVLIPAQFFFGLDPDPTIFYDIGRPFTYIDKFNIGSRQYDIFGECSLYDAIELAYSDDPTIDFNSGSATFSKGYIRISRDGGVSFSDMTPIDGGAWTTRSMSTSNQIPNYLYAVSSGCTVYQNQTSGSNWTQMDTLYGNGTNIVVHRKDNRKVYLLDETGVHYTDDAFATHVTDKTGNWTDVFGFDFASSGSKISMAPVMG